MMKKMVLAQVYSNGAYVCINCREATNCFCYKQNIERLFSHVVVVGMMMVQ